MKELLQKNNKLSHTIAVVQPKKCYIVDNRDKTFSTNVLQRMKSTDLVDVIKEGSPKTYLVHNKYVKVWSTDSKEKSKIMEDLWRAADCEGVSIPLYRRQKLIDKDEYIFWCKKCKGDKFFQNSKTGHPTTLKCWLRKHDSEYLKNMSKMFRVATMGDPQGFYEDKTNGEFQFIDIQRMGSNLMKEYADYIDTQILPSP